MATKSNATFVLDSDCESVFIHPGDVGGGWLGIYYPVIRDLCEPIGADVSKVFNWILRKDVETIRRQSCRLYGYKKGRYVGVFNGES